MLYDLGQDPQFFDPPFPYHDFIRLLEWNEIVTTCILSQSITLLDTLKLSWNLSSYQFSLLLLHLPVRATQNMFVISLTTLSRHSILGLGSVWGSLLSFCVWKLYNWRTNADTTVVSRRHVERSLPSTCLIALHKSHICELGMFMNRSSNLNVQSSINVRNSSFGGWKYTG